MATGVDLGASWIHGINHNPVYDFCNQTGIHTWFPAVEEDVQMYDSNGTTMDDSHAFQLFNNVLDKADKYGETLSGVDSINCSLGFQMAKELGTLHLTRAQLATVGWHIANTEYGAGAPLDWLNLTTWDQDDLTSLDGDHLMVSGGYQQIAEAMAKSLTIRLRHEVFKISTSSDKVHVVARSFTKDRGIVEIAENFDFCIVSVPLGVLKCCVDPSLCVDDSTAFGEEDHSDHVSLEAVVRQTARLNQPECSDSSPLHGLSPFASEISYVTSNSPVSPPVERSVTGSAAYSTPDSRRDIIFPAKPGVTAFYAPTNFSAHTCATPWGNRFLGPTEVKEQSGESRKCIADIFHDCLKQGLVGGRPEDVMSRSTRGLIEFEPPLPDWKVQAVQRLGMGLLNKVALIFPYVFWVASSRQAAFVSSSVRGKCFLLYLFHPQPSILLLLPGVYGMSIEKRSKAEIVAEAVEVLLQIYGMETVPQPKFAFVTKWGSDPFSRGSYTYIPPGSAGRDYDILSSPVNDRLLFAGEHTQRAYPATTHGALTSGRREALRIIEWSTGSPAIQLMSKWYHTIDRVPVELTNDLDTVEFIYAEDRIEGPARQENESWFGCLRCAFCDCSQSLSRPFIGVVVATVPESSIISNRYLSKTIMGEGSSGRSEQRDAEERETVEIFTESFAKPKQALVECGPDVVDDGLSKKRTNVVERVSVGEGNTILKRRKYGESKLLFEKTEDFVVRYCVHEDCCYYTSEIWSNRNGSRWFNVFRGIQRTATFQCVLCGTPGASLSCSYRTCKNHMHLPCCIVALHWPYAPETTPSTPKATSYGANKLFCPSHQYLKKRSRLPPSVIDSPNSGAAMNSRASTKVEVICEEPCRIICPESNWGEYGNNASFLRSASGVVSSEPGLGSPARRGPRRFRVRAPVTAFVQEASSKRVPPSHPAYVTVMLNRREMQASSTNNSHHQQVQQPTFGSSSLVPAGSGGAEPDPDPCGCRCRRRRSDVVEEKDSAKCRTAPPCIRCKGLITIPPPRVCCAPPSVVVRPRRAIQVVSPLEDYFQVLAARGVPAVGCCPEPIPSSSLSSSSTVLPASKDGGCEEESWRRIVGKRRSVDERNGVMLSLGCRKGREAKGNEAAGDSKVGKAGCVIKWRNDDDVDDDDEMVSSNRQDEESGCIKRSVPPPSNGDGGRCWCSLPGNDVPCNSSSSSCSSSSWSSSCSSSCSRRVVIQRAPSAPPSSRCCCSVTISSKTSSSTSITKREGSDDGSFGNRCIRNRGCGRRRRRRRCFGNSSSSSSSCKDDESGRSSSVPAWNRRRLRREYCVVGK